MAAGVFSAAIVILFFLLRSYYSKQSYEKFKQAIHGMLQKLSDSIFTLYEQDIK